MSSPAGHDPERTPAHARVRGRGGALTMFELTREAKYADVFERTWQFVDTQQTDWGSGEWHEAIEPDGRARSGNKAHVWKAGYHNGRALIEAVERIRGLSARRAPPSR